MLIFIIGAIFTILGIASILVYTFKYDIKKELWIVSFGVNTFIGVIMLLIVGCGALLNNTPRAHEEARIAYNAKVEELTSTREAIYHMTDDYAKSVSITQYNTLVREFKEDIKIGQERLKNPWINWFNNYAYKDFDVDVVSYITTF